MIRPGWLIHYPPFFFISSGIKLFRGLLERRLTKLGLVTQPLPNVVCITPPPLMSQPRRLGWPQQTDGICMEGPGKHSITGIWFKQSTISLFIIRRHFGSSPPPAHHLHGQQNSSSSESSSSVTMSAQAAHSSTRKSPPPNATNLHPPHRKQTHPPPKKAQNSVLRFKPKSQTRKKKL